ncbi:MAG: M20/M25/M40 family metallo-hydrolase, partial [Pseudomonadota bacterium]
MQLSSLRVGKTIENHSLFFAVFCFATVSLLAQPEAQIESEIEAKTQDLPYSEAELNQAISLRDQALQGNIGYDVIRSLTTEVGPRLAGSENEARARDWAVAKLQSLGFENVRVEKFTIPGWLRGDEYAEVTSPYPQPLRITALGSSVATPPDGITAPVAYFETLADLKDAPMGSLEGKIAFVSHAMQKTQDGSSYGFTVPLRRDGAREAAARGAVAIVIRSIGTDSHRMPHTGQMSYGNALQKIPAAALSVPDAEQLVRMIDGGTEVEMKLVLTPKSVGPLTSGNVIVDIRGRERPEELVIIGGHLDAWDLGTGAVDDGAGVGITMAAAKLIKDLPVAPKRTVRLILWGSEEVGLLGARAYADRYQKDIENHIIGAESDFGAGKIWKMTSRVGDEDLPTIKAIARVLAPLGVAEGDNAARGGPDLIPLRFLGMPVVSLNQDGRDYFDLHHTPDDTFDKI